MEGAIAHDLENSEQRTSDVAAGSLSFEQLNLDRSLSKCLQAHKFLTPTKIQAAAIPMAVAGMDLLVQSKSGTGKTLIYVLAALQKMNRSVPSPQALIIVPTRELAIQVEDTVNGLADKMRNRNAYLGVSFIGGTDVKRDRMRMARGRIVVGTPGRLLHLIQNNVFNTSAIRLLVLDEADQLYCTDSLQKDVQALVASLQPGSQIIACSATYPNALDERLAKLMNKPVLVSNSERATVLLGIRQFVYELPAQVNSLQDMMAKLKAVKKIFTQVSYDQAVLFANSQSRADSFRNYLRRDGIECELMSGAMKQSDRLQTFKAYRNFRMRIIVATDLMARGVDSSHANLIINLDPPNDLVTYLHRIGRAGRFGSKGIAITFISSPEQSQSFKRIIAEAGTGMSVLQFPIESREGFNFWDYASYDFPYYVKTEAYEQEENELKRIKQRWKGPGDEENVLNTIGNFDSHFENNEQLEDSILSNDNEPLEENQNLTTTLQGAKSQIKPVYKEPLTVQSNQERELNIQTIEEIHGQFTTIADNKENVTDNIVRTLDEANITLKDTGEARMKVARPQELATELVELTPSTEMPAAAPNSINTKTYCLVAPTESSSTTLHPQGVSNTVDDASSIISDSLENDYDSDASYTSCYSISDVQIVWQRALSQRKLQKRRKRNARRRIYLYKKLRNVRKLKVWSREHKRDDQEQTEELMNDSDGEKTIRQLHELANQRPRKFQAVKVLNAMLKKRKVFLFLQKVHNCKEIRKRLISLLNKRNWDESFSDKWIELLYDSICHFFYVDHSKAKQSKKLSLPNYPNLIYYNRLMNIIHGKSGPQPPLNKLSVHVNEQINIPPDNGADEANNDADAYSVNSHSGSSNFRLAEVLHDYNDNSESDSMDAASWEPYSSSGFVESTESASSGIDTSQYDTSSLLTLESTEYEGESDDEEEEYDDDGEVDEEEEYDDEGELDEEEEYDDEGEEYEKSHSNGSQTDSVSLSTLTADCDDNTDELDSESEQPNMPNALRLEVAQARWQCLFQMQYHFIANYVSNYIAIYRSQN